jgi:hypothetical protein
MQTLDRRPLMPISRADPFTVLPVVLSQSALRKALGGSRQEMQRGIMGEFWRREVEASGGRADAGA